MSFFAEAGIPKGIINVGGREGSGPLAPLAREFRSALVPG